MPYCTVVIPTFNGMETLPHVIASVKKQITPWDYDILVVDSGSKDGTLDFLTENMIKMIVIDSSEFGHGKTRNLAISRTNSPYIALLTQDSIPTNNDWLYNLVSAVENDKDIAASFGRHTAHNNADRFTKRDIDAHFENLARYPLLSKYTDQTKYNHDDYWMQILHYFSDNNSCIRRSIWDKIPFADVTFGEDQLWAKSIIDHGFKKAYANNANVYHSHNYNFFKQLNRSYIESKYYKNMFGYSYNTNIKQATRTLISLTKNNISYHNKVDRELFNRIIHDTAVILGSYFANLNTRKSSINL